MKWILIIAIITVLIPLHNFSLCGCKYMRKCYKRMLNSLLEPGENECIENVAMGTATIIVFLKALERYCPKLIKVKNSKLTFEGRALYEVEIGVSSDNSSNVFIIEAGQDAGAETVRMALYIIEQLVACSEHQNLIKSTKWVILPCTNPDGMEYMRTKREYWKKNLRLIDNISYGVDVTRNFDEAWTTCAVIENIFSHDYPGPKAASENETQFITNVFEEHKKNTIQAYVSFRRDGHGIFYPFASVSSTTDVIGKMKKKAAEVAQKVNQKAGLVQWFMNDSIYNMNGQAYCGHSVDYAHNKFNIPYVYEMRMYPESDNEILSQFQSLPKGYESSLRTGYFNGIKELHNSIAAESRKPTNTF